MAVQFLKDLAEKSRRSLCGRLEAGHSAGGNCYGSAIFNIFVFNDEAARSARSITVL